ncbi:hypothetical protein ACHAXS_006794 [Conticribra weissflogii]
MVILRWQWQTNVLCSSICRNNRRYHPLPLTQHAITQRSKSNATVDGTAKTYSAASAIAGMTLYDSLSGSYQILPRHHNHINDASNELSSSSSSSSSLSSSSSPSSTTTRPKGTAWYVCGPTVYDSTHLGHARTYVSLDILRRVSLRLHHDGDSSPRPLYVMNITDVDDKIINRSMEIAATSATATGPANSDEGKETNDGGFENEADPIALARFYEREFWQDLEYLHVLPPDVVCRVSEHVEETIVPYIEKIMEGGMAYMIPENEMRQSPTVHGNETGKVEGSVYFDVRAFESMTNGRTRYGKLAPDVVVSSDFFSWNDHRNGGIHHVDPSGDGSDGNDDEDLGERDNSIQVLRRKRDPRDFCLWKYRPRHSHPSSSSSPRTGPRPEPISVSYPSPWGTGRPGWHVECSAMIERLSRDFETTHEFRIHAGGVDLKFPHHANEIAQAEAFGVANGAYDDGASASAGASIGENETNRRKEWIPHWIHTGHLYVRGRKMSKSLKNFVTVREMLGISKTPFGGPVTHAGKNDDSSDDNETGNTNNTLDNAWSSPADDFRLWCLGLSGSYRGPATYSKERMEEARVLRAKWVRFLIEGQQSLDRWHIATVVSNDEANYRCTNGNISFTGNTSTKLWGQEELELFQTAIQCSINCRKALLGQCINSSNGSGKGNFDLDGTSFVKELTSLAESGLSYIQQVQTKIINSDNPQTTPPSPPEEPLRFVLETMRSQLDLVGFSPRTVRAGISGEYCDNNSDLRSTSATASNTNYSKKERALLDEIVDFRSAIRSSAIGGLRKKDGIAAAKEILGLCDEMRDSIFPSLGVEILDGKVNDDGKNGGGGWRYCSPRNGKKKS